MIPALKRVERSWKPLFNSEPLMNRFCQKQCCNTTKKIIIQFCQYSGIRNVTKIFKEAYFQELSNELTIIQPHCLIQYWEIASSQKAARSSLKYRSKDIFQTKFNRLVSEIFLIAMVEELYSIAHLRWKTLYFSYLIKSFSIESKKHKFFIRLFLLLDQDISYRLMNIITVKSKIRKQNSNWNSCSNILLQMYWFPIYPFISILNFS